MKIRTSQIIYIPSLLLFTLLLPACLLSNKEPDIHTNTGYIVITQTQWNNEEIPTITYSEPELNREETESGCLNLGQRLSPSSWLNLGQRFSPTQHTYIKIGSGILLSLVSVATILPIVLALYSSIPSTLGNASHCTGIQPDPSPLGYIYVRSMPMGRGHAESRKDEETITHITVKRIQHIIQQLEQGGAKFDYRLPTTDTKNRDEGVMGLIKKCRLPYLYKALRLRPSKLEKDNDYKGNISTCGDFTPQVTLYKKNDPCKRALLLIAFAHAQGARSAMHKGELRSMIRQLQKDGAQINAQDQQRRTALDIAKKNKNGLLAAVLKKARGLERSPRSAKKETKKQDYELKEHTP